MNQVRVRDCRRLLCALLTAKIWWDSSALGRGNVLFCLLSSAISLISPCTSLSSVPPQALLIFSFSHVSLFRESKRSPFDPLSQIHNLQNYPCFPCVYAPISPYGLVFFFRSHFSLPWGVLQSRWRRSYFTLSPAHLFPKPNKKQ